MLCKMFVLFSKLRSDKCHCTIYWDMMLSVTVGASNPQQLAMLGMSPCLEVSGQTDGVER